MKKINVLGSALFIAMGVQPASATVLTFSDLVNSRGGEIHTYQAIPDSYGDNVVATTDSVGRYLEGAGFTPNITTSYQATHATTGDLTDYAAFWNTSYGDLVNVVIARQDNHYVEITLTPDNGYTVILDSFDMAGWSESDNPLVSLQVLGANKSVLWESGVNTIHGKNATHDTFTPNISSTGAVTIRWGTSFNIGIDNISFHQKLTNSAPPAPVGNSGCTAQYQTNGSLNIPCVSVPSGTGELIYQATMQMKPLSVTTTFELVSAGQRGAVSDACLARYQLNGHLELPCVALPDGSVYKANMQIIPSSNPMAFELLDAQPK